MVTPFSDTHRHCPLWQGASSIFLAFSFFLLFLFQWATEVLRRKWNQTSLSIKVVTGNGPQKISSSAVQSSWFQHVGQTTVSAVAAQRLRRCAAELKGTVFIPAMVVAFQTGANSKKCLCGKIPSHVKALQAVKIIRSPPLLSASITCDTSARKPAKFELI